MLGASLKVRMRGVNSSSISLTSKNIEKNIES
jgi:hypothetical protein